MEWKSSTDKERYGNIEADDEVEEDTASADKDQKALVKQMKNKKKNIKALNKATGTGATGN